MRIAIFDFDGTVTTKDTLLEFIKFVRGPVSFYAGFLRYAPQLLAYKLGLYLFTVQIYALICGKNKYFLIFSKE